MTIWRMRTVCWIPKAANTHTVCVILIDFPIKQWLQERASVFRCTYFISFVSIRCISALTYFFHSGVQLTHRGHQLYFMYFTSNPLKKLIHIQIQTLFLKKYPCKSKL